MAYYHWDSERVKYNQITEADSKAFLDSLPGFLKQDSGGIWSQIELPKIQELGPLDASEESVDELKKIIDKHMASMKITITISGLLNDLKNGITRCKDDPGYSSERGSIEEKYNLTKADVRAIFEHPNLRNVRVRVPQESRYELIDDVTGTDKEEEKEVKQTAKTFGSPSEAAKRRISVKAIDSDQGKEESLEPTVTLAVGETQVDNAIGDQKEEIPF